MYEHSVYVFRCYAYSHIVYQFKIFFLNILYIKFEPGTSAFSTHGFQFLFFLLWKRSKLLSSFCFDLYFSSEKSYSNSCSHTNGLKAKTSCSFCNKTQVLRTPLFNYFEQLGTFKNLNLSPHILSNYCIENAHVASKQCRWLLHRLRRCPQLCNLFVYSEDPWQKINHLRKHYCFLFLIALLYFIGSVFSFTSKRSLTVSIRASWKWRLTVLAVFFTSVFFVLKLG